MKGLLTKARAKMEKAKTERAKMARGKTARARKATRRVDKKVLESAKRRQKARAKASRVDAEGPSQETSQRTPATIAIRRAIGLQNVHRRKLTSKQRPARPPSRLERSLKLNQPRAKHRMLLQRRVVPRRETARLEPRLERRALCSCR